MKTARVGRVFIYGVKTKTCDGLAGGISPSRHTLALARNVLADFCMLVSRWGIEKVRYRAAYLRPNALNTLAAHR